MQRSTGANTVLVRAGETRTFPARRTDGSYVKGAAVDWIWATEAGLVSDLATMPHRTESPVPPPGISRAADWWPCSMPTARSSGRGWSG